MSVNAVDVNSPCHIYNYDRPTFIAKIKQYHHNNFNQVSDALQHTKQQLQKAIASSNNATIEGSVLTFTRLYSMLLAIWCEARLHTLLYEDNVFTEEERALIYNSGSVEQRWLKALDVAVKKNANIAFCDTITEENAGVMLFTVYKRINYWVTEHFSPVIRNRNKVAHAQWVSPFTNMQDTWKNSTSFTICNLSLKEFREDNILLTNEKISLLNVISGAINSIAIGSNNNGYNVLDFDDINRQVNRHINKIQELDYPAFVIRVQKSYQQTNQ